MTNSDTSKLCKAGFTVLRAHWNDLTIWYRNPESPDNWKRLDQFNTKKQMQDKLKQLLEDKLTVEQ